MSQRPDRCQAADETGRMLTLGSGPQAFDPLGGAGPLLFLGLGPEPGLLAQWFPEAARGAEFVERPGRDAPPPGFRRLEPADLTADLWRSRRVLAFRQNMRLDSAFWGPILAGRNLALLAAPRPGPQVWLPGDENALLLRELETAFAAQGLRARRVPDDARGLPALLRQDCPALYFSVNFRGLDAHGETFHLLRRAGAEVAVWCVDNPFHLLSALKTPYWTQARLLVTDRWFEAPLRGLGAAHVRHLPLGLDPAFAAPGPPPPQARDLAGRFLFVGRSAFPDRDAFFAGARLPEGALGQAAALLAAGERPHFGWWLERLGIARPWPGNAVRAAGLGADQCGLAWRGQCLAAAPELVVVGDAGWRGLLPGADLRPPVDYYGGLAGLYREAACCLNLSNLLLPSGLTQRHFDVWAAGGFLLTDASPGLDIFPSELARATAFSRAAEIAPLFARFCEDSAEKRALARAWRDELLARHTYALRAAAILEFTGLDRERFSAQIGA